MSSSLLARAKSFTDEQLYVFLSCSLNTTLNERLTPCRDEVVEIKIAFAKTHTKTFTIARVLLTLFAPGFAALFEDDESVTLSNIEPEHFDVFVGWLRTRCSRDEGVWKVLGGGDWVCGSFSLDIGADASHRSLLRSMECGGGISLVRLFYQVRRI
jgi:hypothetical protein